MAEKNNQPSVFFSYNSPKLNYSEDVNDNYVLRNLTLEDIKNYQKDADIKNMRYVSNYYYNTSSSYNRIVSTFVNLYLNYYYLDIKVGNLWKGTEEEKLSLQKLYNKALNLLDNSNIESTLNEIMKRVMVDGVFFGLANKTEDKGIVITRLNPNYCRSCYYSDFRTRLVELNVNYFNLFKDKVVRENLLNKFPIYVKEGYFKMIEKHLKEYWVTLPPHVGCCFTIGGDKMAPPLYDSIINIVNYNDYKEIEKDRDLQELNKILVQKFNLDNDGNFIIPPEEMEKMHQSLAKELGDKENINILTTVADTKVLDVQSAQSNTSSNNLEKMVMPKYEDVGLSAEMFYSTTATALIYSIKNTASFLNPLVFDFSNWMTVVLKYYINFGTFTPIFTVVPITWQNQKELSDNALKMAQYGYDLILPYILTGKKQSTLYSSKIAQNDIFNLSEILIPLKSSHTESNKDNTKSELEKQESTILRDNNR